MCPGHMDASQENGGKHTTEDVGERAENRDKRKDH